MPILLTMPALSPTMTQGNLVAWHKKQGDKIKAGDTFFDIETDKAIMSVEAVDEGTLFHIFVSAGTSAVAVGQALAILQEKGDSDEELQEMVQRALQTSASAPVSSPASAPAASLQSTPLEVATPQPDASKIKTEPAIIVPKSSERLSASPLAKKIAQDKGIDLHQAFGAGSGSSLGSGPGGRIVKKDVEALQPTSRYQSGHPTGPETAAFTDTPLSNMRRVIAQRLGEAKQTIPHFYLTVACEMNALMSLRQQLNQSLENQRISVNDFVVKAVALALKDIPDMNAHFLPEGIRKFQNVDVAVAVSLDSGLVTPILRNADIKGIRALSTELKELVAKARSGKLLPSDYQGGGFTISNLGMFQIEHFAAIINPPQVGILAVGASLEKPVAQAGQVKIATVMNVTLSADHRAIDGVVAAKFLRRFQYYMEHPLLMLC
ncbi:MAG: pyruvate dehydrogenase complex dihydrolipoamide acetyltransferase [Alphaproteobacteria bacterium 40-19]|nr:MAG: pyruvate dehydrogenase complex dihydrolipoamide acetyltransferase [Alphaproteobacteria bacterium 40-19]